MSNKSEPSCSSSWKDSDDDECVTPISHGIPKRLKYTEQEQTVMVQYMVENPLTPTRKCVKEMIEKKVIDRSYLSAYEHVREVILPNVKVGILEKPALDGRAQASFYTPKRLRRPSKVSRTPVLDSDAIVVAKYLLQSQTAVFPNSAKFWENSIKNQDITIADPHPSRLVSIYRNHIKGKLDKLPLSENEKIELMSKLPSITNQNSQEFQKQNKGLTVIPCKTPVDKPSQEVTHPNKDGPNTGNSSFVLQTALDVVEELYKVANEETNNGRLAAVLAIEQLISLKTIADAIQNK